MNVNRSYSMILTFVFSLLMGIASPMAQQDTLDYSYVIGQPWEPPARLNTFIGIRPRLLLNADRITGLKERIGTTHKAYWEVVQEKADAYLESAPSPDYTDESAVRQNGQAVPWLSLAYVVSDDPKYLNSAKDWMSVICDHPEWDGNRSLGAGDCLMGLALGYDWLYYGLSSADKAKIRSKLIYQAKEMAKDPRHKERYLSNHCQQEHAGLAAAGFSLHGDAPESVDFIKQAYLVFREAFQLFSDDGSSTEGHNYWGLMAEFLTRYTKMAKDLLGIDYYESSLWLRNAGNFILYSSLPDFDVNQDAMRYGDTSSYGYGTHGPTHILFNIASETQNETFQWLATEMFRKGIGNKDAVGWGNLLWYDETITPTPPDENLPRFHHFEDTGWITSRGSWDADAVMVGFKCGPFHGHKIQSLYDQMASYHGIVNGHGHPDVNHFDIYAHGRWLAEDDGYSKPKWTKYHSIVLVNGKGQLGEGTTYFDRKTVFNAKVTSRIIHCESCEELDYIIGDAATIYKPETGVIKFHRHFLFVKPDVIIVVDDLVTKQPAMFSWLMRYVGSMTQQSEGTYLVQNGDVVMDVVILSPVQSSTNVEYRRFSVSPSDSSSKMKYIIAMHPRRPSDPPLRAAVISESDTTVSVEVETSTQQKQVEIGFHVLTRIDQSEDEDFRPEACILRQNYPNPFNNQTVISYLISEGSNVSLDIYNTLGQRIKNLDWGYRNQGRYTRVWDGIGDDGKHVETGVYFIRGKFGSYVQCKKMVHVK